MKKRSCSRFSIPGTTLYFKEKKFFFLDGRYTRDYFPVVNLSKGGAKFLCHQRLTPGRTISIKLNVPGRDAACEIKADIRWISKNPEQSYRYQTGIAFKSFGTRPNENSLETLNFLESVEADVSKSEEKLILDR